MREKLQRFMWGRYGNDNFNQFLLAVAFVSLLISFFGGGLFYLVATVVMVYAYFRMFSRNVYKRSAENRVYMEKTYKLRCFFARQKNMLAQRRTHHIYRCPSCRQKIRIPRGKGRIEIRCPKCSTTFIKKS